MDPIDLSDEENYGGNGFANPPQFGSTQARLQGARMPPYAAQLTDDQLEIMKAEDLPTEQWRAGHDANMIYDNQFDEQQGMYDDEMGSEDDEPAGPKRPDFNSASKIRPESKEEAAKVNEVVTKVYDDMQEYLESIPYAPQPPNMTTVLMAHQQQALHWMSKQEEKDAIKGGILADDMGVGKTVETIALLCARPVTCTLIICPMTLIHHWKSELERHTEKGTFRVGLYYGTLRPKTLEEMKSYNIIITSYGTLTSDYSKIRKTLGIADDEVLNNGSVAAMGGPKGAFLYSIRWRRIVLDEAQYIKNRYSSAARACTALPGSYRLALSGTPIQNSLNDLFSLLKFIRFPDYAEYAEFRKHILTPVGQNKASGYRELAQLIRRSMLRRRKDQELRGRKIVELPAVTSNVIHLDFEPGDLLFYQATEQRIMDQFNELASHGQAYVMKHYTHVLVLLLRLRQAACHPYLVAMGHMQPTQENTSRNAVWDFAQLETFTEKIVEALKKARKSIEQQHTGELTDEEIMKLITERVAMGFVINSTGAECVACKRPAESPVMTACRHIHCAACTNERRGQCGKCNEPYGLAVGKPLRAATPGELYAAIHPDVAFDLGAAIDAAEGAREAGMEVDIKPVLSRLEAAKPKITKTRSAPNMKFTPAAPVTLFKNTASTLPKKYEVISLDSDEEDDLVLVGAFGAGAQAQQPKLVVHAPTGPSAVSTGPFAPATPVAPYQRFQPTMTFTPNLRNASFAPSASSAPAGSAGSLPPKGSLKVTLRPVNPQQSALNSATVIKHDMHDSLPTSSSSPLLKPFMPLGRRTPLGGESSNVVMSRARLTDYNKFRPTIMGKDSVPITLEASPSVSPRPETVASPGILSMPLSSEPESPEESSETSSLSVTKAASPRSVSPPIDTPPAVELAITPIVSLQTEDPDPLSFIPIPAMPRPRKNGTKKKNHGSDDEYDLEGPESDRSDDEDNGDDLKDFIVNDDDMVDDAWEMDNPNQKKRKRDKAPALAPSLAQHTQNGAPNDATQKRAKVEEARDDEAAPARDPEIPLPNFRITGAAARRAQRATELKRHSTKLTALLSALELLKNAGGEDKIVIYSQFVRYMDIIEVPLRNWGWKMLRLDGSLSQPQRADLLHRFDTDPTCRILIISLKAGGVGINLTVANHVFLMDPWWNTAVEKQAIDRVHRIGQKKAIFVTRFFVKQTVEQRILAIQEGKDKVADRALSNRRGDAPPRAGLSFAELRQLFTSSFNNNADTDPNQAAQPNFVVNRLPSQVDALPARTLSNDQSFAADPFRPL